MSMISWPAFLYEITGVNIALKYWVLRFPKNSQNYIQSEINDAIDI